ncbi:alpha-amylase family glycosyl hydrolase [Chitiniphilus purpureus]|uniref:Alpha-amylase family glycosyl hydrolase n=1 Tax=Chitiniphilus purpureus TaxID=2981137 RepID=A0ABY6DLF1_9NEIS|nr:alpha-amylase family glycosyl hydrolase [Chitiniphilus sp. CD1]UXY14867.1 alpha-amylase family glycosyl hydrolase [Chitiniphilus sp. CD1]
MKKTQWWRGAVIYQIYPRSFMDSNGDGVGDLPGITERLPYLKSLNVDAVWISPFFKSPMKDFGYDVSDYCDVDPLFGTLADFDVMVAEAHRLGLRIIIDQVLSHTSDLHPWFVESRASRDNPKADWYIWADPKPDGTPPNNWLSVFGGSAWQWDSRRLQFYMHNFLTSQPDLNFHNPEVQAAVLDAVEFWLKRGVDGFRFDACNYHFHDRKLRSNPPAGTRPDTTSVSKVNPYGMQQHRYDKSRPQNLRFLAALRTLLDRYGAASVGEIGDDDSLGRLAEYTSGGDKLHQAYSFTLLTEQFGTEFITTQVQNMERAFRRYEVPGWVCWSIGNHDVPRVLTRWGKDTEDPAFPKLMMALVTSLRGSACVYQGEELGLPEADIPYELLQDPYGKAFWPDFKGRDGCRTPMPWRKDESAGGFTNGHPWLPIPPAHLARAAEVQEGPPDSILNFTRLFLAWRRTQPALIEGDIEFVRAPAPLLIFIRTLGKTRICAAFNLSGAPQRWSRPRRLKDAMPLPGHGLSGAHIEHQILHMAPWGGGYWTLP